MIREERMLKVPYGQDPYSVIGKYIRDHITVIEDIIAVIEIDDITTNQLFMVDMDNETYFIWNNDWYEGEKDVALIDFFPVSEAINPSAQSDPCEEDEQLDFVQEHKKLPIILEARTKGSWIEVGREEGALGIEYKTLRCSKCGWESSLPIPRNFCPECGFDMREGTDEQIR